MTTGLHPDRTSGVDPGTTSGTGARSSSLVTWAPTALVVLMLIALARQAALGLGDPDTLWHILAGKELWRTGQFSGADRLASFTTEPWVLHQWLPDLALAGAERVGGLPAVVWLAHAFRLAVCVAVYFVCRRWSSPLAATLITGLTLLALADSLSPRPQMVGFVLLVVTVWAWLQTSQDGRRRWWLVPLTWLWASSHGTWPVGLTVAAVVLVGMVADRSCTLKEAGRLALVPGASLVAALLTPLGPGILTSFVTVHEISAYVQEWRRPALDSSSVLALAGVACVTALLWATRRAPTSWTWILLFCLGIGWGSVSMRTVGVGAIILAPLAAGSLDRAIGRLRTPVSRSEAVTVCCGAVASLMVGAALAAAGPQQPVDVPRALDPVLSALPEGTVV